MPLATVLEARPGSDTQELARLAPTGHRDPDLAAFSPKRRSASDCSCWSEAIPARAGLASVVQMGQVAGVCAARSYPAVWLSVDSLWVAGPVQAGIV
jgi:hypothetical protein